MSGFEVCRLIKSDPRTAAIPVIQVSATAVDVADRAHGLTQGADAYLVEPTEPAELLATVTAALRYSRARQRAERTAAMLAELASVTLDINAAETFDGLAAAAATGAARIFAAAGHPDPGDARRADPPDVGQPGQSGHGAARRPARAGGPGRGPRARPGQGERDRGPSPADDWLGIVPDSTLRADVCLAVARTKPGKPPVAIAVDRAGVSGDEDMQILRQLVAVGRGWRRGAALLGGRAPGGADPAAELPARGPARDTGHADGVPLPARERPGRGRRRLLRGAAVAGRGADRHRRRAGALAGRRDRDGGTAARAARLRQRRAPAAGDHRPGQRGAAALPPGHHRHLVPGARRPGDR